MAENQVNEILELDTTLKVGNNTYNINAEKAGQVENSLKITEVITGEETTANKEFNGSTPVDISVVPSTGGTFTGAINVPDVPEDTSEVPSTSVLNYKGILNKVLTEISNHSTVYEWEAEEDAFDRGDLKAKLEGAAPSGICVVIGVEKDRLVFGRYNEKNKVLPAYFYICSDSGNIYYCTYDDYIKLAAESDSARELNYYGNQTTPDTPSISYTAEDLKNKFDDIDARTLYLGSKPDFYTNGNIYDVLARGGAAVTHPPKVKVLYADGAGALVEYSGKIGEGYIKDRLTIAQIRSIDEKLDLFIDQIYSGNEILADSATSAVKATQDSDGKQINYNYYRSTYNTSGVNSITISTSTPASSQGINGDIWIKYKV